MPVSVSPAKDGLLEVATACGIETSVPETITPVPAVSVVMFALPSKLIPLIVLAVARMVAVAEFPEVSWFPAVLTPARSIFALPSNDTPPIVLAVAKVVASEDNAIAISAEPSKLVPPIVLAVAKVVAVPALPVAEAATTFKASTNDLVTLASIAEFGLVSV